jgi:uncharacterized protein (DUF58 family)
MLRKLTRRFASDSTSNNSFSTAIDAAAGLIQVAVGLTVGLYLRVCAQKGRVSVSSGQEETDAMLRKLTRRKLDKDGFRELVVPFCSS